MARTLIPKWNDLNEKSLEKLLAVRWNNVKHAIPNYYNITVL